MRRASTFHSRHCSFHTTNDEMYLLVIIELVIRWDIVTRNDDYKRCNKLVAFFYCLQSKYCENQRVVLIGDKKQLLNLVYWYGLQYCIVYQSKFCCI